MRTVRTISVQRLGTATAQSTGKKRRCGRATDITIKKKEANSRMRIALLPPTFGMSFLKISLNRATISKAYAANGTFRETIG
jgi:hypothetical protein